jgi:hypothetical protein
MTDKSNHRKVQSSLHGISEEEVKPRKILISNSKAAKITLAKNTFDSTLKPLAKPF